MKKEDQLYLSSLQILNAFDSSINQSINFFNEKLNQSSVFNHNCNEDFCSQHPQKKAKYIQLNSGRQDEKLCAKCAVLFAQQGYKIKLIEEDNDKKKQTDSFIDQLNCTKAEIDNIHSNFQCTEANFKQFYNDQYKQVVKTFKNIEQQLNIRKSELLFTLSQSLWSGIQITNQLKVQAKQIEHQLGTYINDIENHYDKIVQMSTLPFNQIMGGYSSKLFRLQQCLRDIQQNKITYLHYEGRLSGFDQFLKELTFTNQNDQLFNVKNHESTRSNSEQQTCKLIEKEKRLQSLPIAGDIKHFDNSRTKPTQNFIITEQSVEEWMINSNSKQRKTEPIETSVNPNIFTANFVKTQTPVHKPTVKQEKELSILDKLISEFSQIKQDRIKKIQSKTPEVGKKIQHTIQNKLSPKLLYKNYFK